MLKWFRYFLVIFFWVYATGSMLMGHYYYGVLGLILMGVTVIYPEFRKRNNDILYWAVVWIGFLIVLVQLHFENY